MKWRKLYLFLPIFIFLLLPKNTFAATYETFSLKSVSSMETTGSLSYQNIITTDHYGRTFHGYSRSGVVGRSRFVIDASTTNLKTDKQYDISFLIFYSNVKGQEGSVPMVFFQNKMCSVVSAGYYKDISSTFNFNGYSHAEGGYGDTNGYFNAWHTTFDNLTITSNTAIDVNYLFGVTCNNVSVNNLEQIPVDVYTGVGASKRGTPEYSIQNALSYELNSTSAIKDSIDKNTDVQKETTEATKKQTETIKDKDTTESQKQASGFFDDFESNDYGLSDIITMPLTFIKGLSNGTCNSLNLPLPFVEQNVTLPCMTSIYQTYFNSFLTLYQTITTGFIAYWVCINIFRLVQGFKNPDNDEIEVMEL